MAEKKIIKQERIKADKDGLDVWPDIGRFAKDGFESIPEDDFERLKWFGIYTQRPKEDGFFMVRLKVPGGRLTSARLREIGRLANEHSRGIADITTRQNVQLHWLRIEQMPDLLDRVYRKMGMEQMFSCGDTPRNVIACPLAGIDADPIVDTKGLAFAISEMFRKGEKEFSNLPRKMKTSVGGCRKHCCEPQIHDIAFFGAMRQRNGHVDRGLGLAVGGGLRDTPHFAQSLRVFLEPKPDLLADVSRHVAHLFRDTSELREGRLRARLKFHMARSGWEAIRDDLENRLGYALEHDDSVVFPSGAGHDDHTGIGAQADGHSYVGIPVPRGRLTGDQMIFLADLADEFCSTGMAELVTTIKQNIILLNILPARVEELCDRLEDGGLPARSHLLRSRLISCTGIEFCKLAIVETKQRAAEILEYLEARVPLDQPLMISVTGCPNSCAQYQIADIGLQGVPTMQDEQRVHGFHMLLGGKTGDDPAFAEVITDGEGRKIKIPTSLVHLVIEDLLLTHKSRCPGGEPFSTWARRTPMPELAALVTQTLARAGGSP